VERLRKGLLADRAAFLGRVRRLAVLGLAALGCVVAVLLYVRAARIRAAARPPAARKLSGGDVRADALLLPPAAGGDASQLVPSALLYAERDANPLRITPEGGKTTLVDYDILAAVLKAVKAVPQRELEARVDRSIVWEDFDDPVRRMALRGRLCQFRGTLYRLVENPTAKFPALGIERLYEGQIRDALGRWYCFYCFERPSPPLTRADEAVLTGVFYKLIKYTARSGEQIVAPLIIARTVRAGRRYAPPSFAGRIVDRAPDWALAAGLGALAAIICLVMTLLFRRPHVPPLRDRRGGH